MIEDGQRAEALAELKLIQTTNADNAQLAELIGQLESGTFAAPPLSVTPPVTEEPVTTEVDGVTTTTVPPATDLLVPLNQRDELPTTPAPTAETNPAP
jgi:hypothetical protein